MENFFISELKIEHVRHLRNIRIPLSDEKMKHLILTGKKGSGKTSVLEALGYCLQVKAESSKRQKEVEDFISFYENKLQELQDKGGKSGQVIEAENNLGRFKAELADITAGISVQRNINNAERGTT